ncbi:MAG: bifunctional glutamate N-acetyltransferase/amino-acid acetyltransferase ArgJ [Candidatus Margulisiibacteriota bacterium]
MSKLDWPDLEGVYAGAIASGIRPDRLDLGFLYVTGATAAAAVFTTNHFAASSIAHSRDCLKKGVVKAIVVNSGNANAVTGSQGEADTRLMADIAAKKLGLETSQVMVASTGIIGVPMPMDKVSAGLEALLADPKQRRFDTLSTAILTTDLVEKTVYVTATIAARNVVVAGVAKGSGMIAPHMATMLAFLVTNADLTQSDLQEALSSAVKQSFNRVSVDTDTSTNDMVTVLANGVVKLETQDDLGQFCSLLNQACQSLAKQIARDGEGATRLVEVSVRGAASNLDADQVSRQIVDSPLVKTALYGADPNWGRLLMAIGKNPDIKMDTQKVDISVGAVPLLKSGLPLPFDREAVILELKSDPVVIRVNLNIGTGEGMAWGCDLTEGYIRINTKYN